MLHLPLMFHLPEPAAPSPPAAVAQAPVAPAPAALAAAAPAPSSGSSGSSETLLSQKACAMLLHTYNEKEIFGTCAHMKTALAHVCMCTDTVAISPCPANHLKAFRLLRNSEKEWMAFFPRNCRSDGEVPCQRQATGGLKCAGAACIFVVNKFRIRFLQIEFLGMQERKFDF
eukprot:scaffold223637_cov15-Tisochrysis_lutea.AAC.2